MFNLSLLGNVWGRSEEVPKSSRERTMYKGHRRVECLPSPWLKQWRKVLAMARKWTNRESPNSTLKQLSPSQGYPPSVQTQLWRSPAIVILSDLLPLCEPALPNTTAIAQGDEKHAVFHLVLIDYIDLSPHLLTSRGSLQPRFHARRLNFLGAHSQSKTQTFPAHLQANCWGLSPNPARVLCQLLAMDDRQHFPKLCACWPNLIKPTQEVCVIDLSCIIKPGYYSWGNLTRCVCPL